MSKDIDAIERIKRGDSEVFQYLYDTYYYQLFCIAKQYVSDSFTAETVVSDVFFTIWEKRDTIEIHTSLIAYLVRCVRNNSINLLHKNYVNREVNIDNIESSSPLCFLSDDYPLGQLIEKELSSKIQTEIDALPDETRDVFLLSRIEELKYDEIAERLNISINTVKYHIKQALKILRCRLLILLIYFLL